LPQLALRDREGHKGVLLCCTGCTILTRWAVWQLASAIGKAAMGGSGNTNPEGTTSDGALQQSHHPTALMFHIGFKLAALFVYLFGGFLSSSFVVSFVFVVLLLAFDFWTVKNVSGRLLVGLRWWNEVKEDGTNEWRFESREDTSRISDLDSRVFWLTLWLTPILWSIFTISTFFSFNYGWMLCCLVCPPPPPCPIALASPPVRRRGSNCVASLPARCTVHYDKPFTPTPYSSHRGCGKARQNELQGSFCSETE
jgi:hypothetical protein